jgi:hypothetical protein
MVSLRGWLTENGPQIARRWNTEIETRWELTDRDSETLLAIFTERLLRLLPECFGDRREEALSRWGQAARLYGSYALHRGLAAGEVVEEIHILRTLIFRQLLGSPAEALLRLEIPVRDFLTLNEVLDGAVAMASVAYVDDLFFAHLQGSGVPESSPPEFEEELRRQLDSLNESLIDPLP